MTTAVGVLNVVIGLVYLQYGTLTAIELRRNWSRLGFSHFGAAWIAMAFTCGPHHMIHGVHILFEGRNAGSLDLVAVAVGAPAGLTWWLLRLEAHRGGRGDRHIAGNPLWILALPTLFGMYVTALGASVITADTVHWDRLPSLIPNMLLVPIYLTIALYITRTQIANQRPLGGWSLSGVSLGVVFWTCAVMHAIYAFYSLTGRYGFDTHGYVIDVIGVPAGLYFLGVVRGLHRGSFSDWNSVARRLDGAAAPTPAAAAAAEPSRVVP